MDVGQKGLAHHHGDVLIWKRGGLTLAGGGGALRVGGSVGGVAVTALSG